ncbi:MAG: Modification methylase TaqI [Candidatus Ordinivivax streblomastigis]|uniref:Modification methylase TaqI n=1 Tax=Candidatus Ordinivivax streblomastigis TaxID=2540710 RepID=A0A5M8P345_9BACT|nr:MAG: Modification methylase TaqI [Candidatus Ordinivivax streblomastigis]
MNYPIIPQHILQNRRAEINEKIIFSIDTGKNLVPLETIYNCYTGIGGLHNLKQADFPNYHEYAQAKKEIEIGQFFTPHDICRQMVDLVSPESTDMILDMCCGMGNFFNHLSNHYNAYGFDIEVNSVKVAKQLYPNANIDVCDIRRYEPELHYDIVIGNPPFNLDWNGTLSQYYYCNKAYKVLNPAGLLIIIVPCSFLQSDFWNKSQVNGINQDFSFIGQTKLPSNAFTSVGVENFETKIMAFMRESYNIEMQPYSAETFLSLEELQQKISEAKEVKKALRLQLHQESNKVLSAEEKDFEYRLKKYLYELKTHKHLQEHYNKALALVTKYRNQKPPVGCSSEEYTKWEKSKLTHAKVLSIIRRYIRNQNIAPRKETALVRTSYGYKVKNYNSHLGGIDKDYVSMYDLVANGKSLPLIEKTTPKNRKQYRQAKKLVDRKKKEYQRQSVPFSEMERNAGLDEYIETLTFVNKEKETCQFTELQKQDMGLLFQKRYSLLNWQQGSGKTAVAYHYGKYLMKQEKVKNVVILAPAIAVKLTWEAFMKRNNEKFVTLSKIKDFERVPEGIFIIISISMLGKLERAVKRFLKTKSQKICLLFDESDEITSPNSQRTKNSLSLFRRLKYKMLATGTTTRNNIGELYSQFELLYNNSANMLCNCLDFYYENKEREIESTNNDYYGKPFPPRGANLFRGCFCPGKASVFGIEKQNQDVYQKTELSELIGKTIITRKFKEFAGEKYSVHTHSVTPSMGEREVYRTIMEEFHRICSLYFESTGDGRKDASLRLVRQINLLIKACSVPNHLSGYFGEIYPRKAKAIVDLVRNISGKVAVGCTTLDALDMYSNYLSDRFPDRQLFVIKGDVDFKKRQTILDIFEATEDGILVCTQQSLKSSANVPSCNDVILEALQWNIPKMEQFYFRFIRLDSKEHTRVHFVTYEDSIEQNLMALVLTKERLNEFIKTGEVKEESEIFDEFNISPSIIESLLCREQDDKGHFHICWGQQKVS